MLKNKLYLSVVEIDCYSQSQHNILVQLAKYLFVNLVFGHHQKKKIMYKTKVYLLLIEINENSNWG